MAIADLLMSQHRWGRTRCRRFLAAVPMSETKTIGSMTDRQRRALARAGGVGTGFDAAFAVSAATGTLGRRLYAADRRRRSPGPRVAISTM